MIVRPRLNDYHNIPITQEEVDFAIPFLNEDVPLYVDPFLLWKSPSQMDNSFHTVIADLFNRVGALYLKDEKKAIEILIKLSECDEVGLGNSINKRGTKIGDSLSNKILSVFKDIPQIRAGGIVHFESLQLLVDGFSKDRVSDIACNLLKSFLIDYTIQESKKYGIPCEAVVLEYLDAKTLAFIEETVTLPINPETKEPILLVPKRWLRFVPWISYDDYYSSYLAASDRLISSFKINKVQLLEYNRNNYDQILTYIKRKQHEQSYCKNDPLFTQIPVLSSKRKQATILKLPAGKINNSDKLYEDNLGSLLASMLYPELDFAQTQSRTDSGVLIRDLIFYNNTSNPFLKEIYNTYNSRQIVFELKNVQELSNDHVNQLNRYLNDEFGGFGVIFTRNSPPKNVLKNIINLWAGQRRCILVLDDADLKHMCQIYEDKQRKPVDVINKKFREFIRSCPS